MGLGHFLDHLPWSRPINSRAKDNVSDFPDSATNTELGKLIGDTPVINGQGLIKLLFHLPGKKARAFVAEAAEKLVRFLGGDETLIAEIHRNRLVATADPNSIQAFMADNVVEQNLARPAATDVAAAAQNERFGDVQNPWIAPDNWPQQQELFRYQVDPEAEAELQRSLVQQREVAAQKREAHVRQIELLKLKHDLSLASFDHKRKYANPPTTRSAHTNIRGGNAGSKMLIHPDWDIKNPVTLHQAVAIFIDHFFEFGQVENVVMHYAIYTLFGAVMRYNYLGFESIADECVPAFHNQTMYKYATMIPPIAFACISIAKTQFPKTVTKNKTRAWGWNMDATDGYYVGTVPMSCLMYLQPKMEHVLALGAYLREQKQQQT